MQMSVTVLLENHADNNGCMAEHGLSLFIETPGHHILFDTGASSLFARNAAKMELELFGADSIVISHGHMDHGGGIAKALREASNANIYLHKNSVSPCYFVKNGKKKYIGFPDSALKALGEADEMGRAIYLEDDKKMSENSMIFTSAKFADPDLHSNLFREYPDGEIDHDDFSHEIFLMVEGDYSSCLFAGCSHSGILKIIEDARGKSKKPLKHLFGGIHTGEIGTGKINSLAANFADSEMQFFLGHCTGIIQFSELHRTLANKLNPLHTGANFTLEI